MTLEERVEELERRFAALPKPETESERLAREAREWEANRIRNGLQRDISVAEDRIKNLDQRINTLETWATFLKSVQDADKAALAEVVERLNAGIRDTNETNRTKERRRLLERSIAAIANGPWEDVLDLDERAAAAGFRKQQESFTTYRFHLSRTERAIAEHRRERAEVVTARAKAEAELALTQA